MTGLAGLRPGEGRVIGLIAAVFATLEVGRGLGEVGVNTLVLTRLSADALPWLYIPLGSLSMVIAISFGAALGRVRRARLFGVTLVGIGGVLAIEWAALAMASDIVAVTWLTVMAAGSIATTVGWTVATSSMDARQAKRLFPVCTAAAIAGAFTGSLVAGPLARLIGTTSLVLAEGLLFVVAAILIQRVAATARGAGWQSPSGPSRRLVTDLRVGVDEVRTSPLLRLVAVAYVLFAILMFSVSFPFLRAAREAAGSEAALADTLGLLSALITATSFVVSLVVAKRFYARFGVAAAALILPIVYLVGFGLWIVRFTFPTAAAVMVVQQVTQRGLSNAAWSAFYNVVPTARRAQVLAFMDGVPGQLGTILSGVLLLTAGRLLAPEHVFWLGFVAAAACTMVVIAIRRRYADALVRTLRSGAGEQVLEGGPGLGDLMAVQDVRAALIAALESTGVGDRTFAASMLARSSTPEGTGALVHAINDDDPRVRATAAGAILAPAAKAMVGAGDIARAEATLASLLDGDAAARAEGLGVMVRLRRGLAPDRRAATLADPSAPVRAMCITLLAQSAHSAQQIDVASTDALVHGLTDPEPMVRRAAATALAGRERADPRVLRLLEEGTPDAQQAALLALLGHAPEVRTTVLTWAGRQVDRALWLAEARVALTPRASGDDTGDDTAEAGHATFLLDVLDARVARQRDLALTAMAVLGAPSASGVIRRSLASRDPDVRAQAIEALDSVGDRPLGAAIARLLELAPSAAQDLDTTLDRLRHDDDPWIRGLARRTRLHGGRMATDDAIEALETMLQLRRVPLFQGLAPEDLQRLAMVATERTFAAGVDIITEGETGEELFVILDGGVVVTRRAPDGTDRFIRTYAAGDHIGELAVLRDRPRAATVRAREGGVTVLVLDGPGLRAILRERPDAAMAMLGTLAERISAQ